MSVIKWLNNFLFLENLFGIYRNYSCQKKIKKYLIILQVFVQTMLYCFIEITKEYFLFTEDDINRINCFYFAISSSVYLNTMSSILAGVYYNRAFMSYFKSISRVSEWCKYDRVLINSVKKLYWCSISFILLCTIFQSFRSVRLLEILPQMNKFILVPIYVTHTIIRITTMFQYFMFFFVTMIVVNLSKCLISLISAVQQSLGSCNTSSDEQCEITKKQIQGWVELYRDLANCCEKVTLSYGHQYAFSATLSVLNYVLMIYLICYRIVLKIEDTTELENAVISMCTYASFMILPIIAGQLIRNQGMKFHRVSARLYNTMIIIDSREAEAKLIKDLTRLIKKNPLEIKLLSKIPVGMYMLPVILTLAVNYLVVMMQINHII